MLILYIFLVCVCCTYSEKNIGALSCHACLSLLTLFIVSVDLQSLAMVSRCPMTASVMGNIMAVAAVLLTHIDRNHVGNIKPNSNLHI